MTKKVTKVPPLPAPLKEAPGAWKPTPVTPPLSHKNPSPPKGGFQRYLVAHDHDYGVLCVVWDESWFRARERAEGFLHESRERLLLVEFPPLPGGIEGEGWSARMIAEYMGFTMHEQRPMVKEESETP